MEMIDCHLHVEALDQRSLELMALSGIKAVISHTSLPEAYENIPSQAIFDFADRMLGFHSWRTSKFFIDTYVCVGVSMVGVPIDYEEALARLPGYLDKERVVGIGEIGLEPSSATCPDLDTQEKILKAQLTMAKEYAKPVAIHTPPVDKPRWAERYLAMVRDLRLDPCQVIVDHADDSVAKTIIDSGCNAAITVQPWRRLKPADAARIVQATGTDRMLIDSDCSILESDPLSVPKTAFEMRKLGMSESDIRKVVWENPRKLFKLG